MRMAPDLILPNRRGFLIGAAASLIAAPAIVRAANLMAVRPYSALDALALDGVVDMGFGDYQTQYRDFQRQFLAEYRKISDPKEARDFNVAKFGEKMEWYKRSEINTLWLKGSSG